MTVWEELSNNISRDMQQLNTDIQQIVSRNDVCSLGAMQSQDDWLRLQQAQELQRSLW